MRPLSTCYTFTGPKMYIATSTSHDDQHSGSTRLHLDLSAAVNILMWASTPEDGRRGYALWQIFAVEDTPLIKEYLRARQHVIGIDTQGDPIHNQQTYITPTMLEELRTVHNVRPYVIRQFVGDAVFIPAGCPHQVSHVFRLSMICIQFLQVCNQADCIKIASDFISIESVPACKWLAEEFRLQRMSRGWPEDVIPFHSMLYYTWLSADITLRVIDARRPPQYVDVRSQSNSLVLIQAVVSRRPRTSPL